MKGSATQQMDYVRKMYELCQQLAGIINEAKPEPMLALNALLSCAVEIAQLMPDMTEDEFMGITYALAQTASFNESQQMH